MRRVDRDARWPLLPSVVERYGPHDKSSAENPAGRNGGVHDVAATGREACDLPPAPLPVAYSGRQVRRSSGEVHHPERVDAPLLLRPPLLVGGIGSRAGSLIWGTGSADHSLQGIAVARESQRPGRVLDARTTSEAALARRAMRARGRCPQALLFFMGAVRRLQSPCRLGIGGLVHQPWRVSAQSHADATAVRTSGPRMWSLRHDAQRAVRSRRWGGHLTEAAACCL